MVRIWKEENLEHYTKYSNLVPIWLYFVEVCGFTFKFHSVEQLEQTLEYYTKKLHPSSIIPNLNQCPEKIDRSLIQRWYEKLPLYLRKEAKRKKVVAALQKAVHQFSSDNEYRSVSMHRTKPVTRKSKSIRIECVDQSYWCRICDTALGYGRCRRCQKRRKLDPEKFKPRAMRIAHCNMCGVSLGQGTCQWCKTSRTDR